MKISKWIFLFSLSFLLIGFSGCKPNPPVQEKPIEPNPETAVQLFTLDSPLNTPNAEISGMAWAGEWLVLLPQYPSRFDNQLFRIHKDDLKNAVQNNNTDPLPMETITLDSAGLEKEIRGFEGFEAIAFNENSVYLTIEAKQGKMQGYIVRGEWSESARLITLNEDELTEINPQADLDNMSDESILVFGRRVVTLYEANGLTINPDPIAHVFDLDLQPADTFSFPAIEYRVTDASSVDQNGQFWVINYFYPGDTKLKPAHDVYHQTYGEGLTHSQSVTVERLVALQFTEDGIVPVETAPIEFVLLPDDEARNWEGLVRWDDFGFIVVTDKFPDTLLGFVPFP